jgi:hypothetical protein
MVCGVKAEQVKQYLTDLFTILIEKNRKGTKEVRLNFEGLGSLRLYKNGELSFETGQLSATMTILNLDTKSVLSARMKERDEDASTVLDRASGIMSFNGGSNFSVKSSFLDKLSVLTPQSKMSGISRISRNNY